MSERQGGSCEQVSESADRDEVKNGLRCCSRCCCSSTTYPQSIVVDGL